MKAGSVDLLSGARHIFCIEKVIVQCLDDNIVVVVVGTDGNNLNNKDFSQEDFDSIRE